MRSVNHIKNKTDQVRQISKIQCVQQLQSFVANMGASSTIMIMSFGLLLLSFAFGNAWKSSSDGWVEALFWAGFLLIWIPIAWQLVKKGGRELTRRERVGWLIVLGLSLYLARVLRNPVTLTFTDELLHWRGTNDVIQTGHLYTPNPLLPIGSYYPGLQVLSAALIQILNSPLFLAAMIIVGVARLVMTLSLYFFYEEVGLNKRTASLATLLYMANPGFVFFNGMYAYESLALPLATVCLYAVARNARRLPDRTRLGFNLVGVIALAATVVTHHLTSFALAAFLGLWAVVSLLVKRRQSKKQKQKLLSVMDREALYWFSGFAIFLVGSWTILATNNLVVRYLTPNLTKGLNELLSIVSGNASGRQLFKSYSGQVAPLWEQVTSFACVGLLLAGLPLGCWQIWRNYRSNLAVLTLGVATLAYPTALALRLTSFGAEISNRTSEFLYLAIAPVLALAVEGILLTRAQSSRTAGFLLRGVWVLVATIIFCGGLIMGFASWTRLPGPYLVAADTRSFEIQSQSAANWARKNLGADNRIISDRVNRLLMGSYGVQRIVTNYGDSVNVSSVFFGESLSASDRVLLKFLNVRYAVIDRRLSTGLPMAGIYIEQGEPNAFQHRQPINANFLAKFDRADNVDRFFDSGDIQLYDLKDLESLPVNLTTNLPTASYPLLKDAVVDRQHDASVLVNLPDNWIGWLWLIAGLPLLLFLPGYLFCRVVFKKSLLPPSGLELVTLSLGVSVSVIILMGMALNLLPLVGGLQTWSWLASLGILSMGLFLAARPKTWTVGRRTISQLTKGFGKNLSMPISDSFLISHLAMVLKFIVIALVTVIIIAIALIVSARGAANPTTPGFTQFWVTNEQLLGVHNSEETSVNYRIEVSVANHKVREWDMIELQPGQSWTTSLGSFLPSPMLNGAVMEFKLYRMDKADTQVYRYLKVYR